MLLSDRTIKRIAEAGDLITPFREKQLQPASYDLRLGDLVQTLPKIDASFENYQDRNMDYVRNITGLIELPYGLKPKEFVLGTTMETLDIPKYLAAKFEGKSTLGRMGLMTHITAGFIDPGFHGELTLELYNVSENVVLLKPGMRIGQVAFMSLDKPCEYGYDETGNYQNQKGPTTAFKWSVYGQDKDV